MSTSAPDTHPSLPVAPPARLAVTNGASLVRCDPALAASTVEAINTSLQHLQPWMAWASEPATLAGIGLFLAASVELWDQHRDFSYSIVDPAEQVIGGCGLHQRLGPGALEIGYWVHVDAAGRGLATASARALTGAALDLDGIHRVEIHCEEHNVRSARVPEKLGYRYEGLVIPDGGPCAGRSTQIWVITEPEWRARTP